MNKGKISLARSQGHGINESNCIHITLEDESSGIPFLSLTIGLKEFSEMVTGLHGCDCAFTLNNLDLIGKVREFKVVTVAVPERLRTLYSGKGWTEADYQEVLGEVEIDGWTAYRDDLFNHHRIKQAEKDFTYIEVGLTRYV